jgi:serine/threonine protein phosphatase PrpC
MDDPEFRDQTVHWGNNESRQGYMKRRHRKFTGYDGGATTGPGVKEVAPGNAPNQDACLMRTVVDVPDAKGVCMNGQMVCVGVSQLQNSADWDIAGVFDGIGSQENASLASRATAEYFGNQLLERESATMKDMTVRNALTNPLLQKTLHEHGVTAGTTATLAVVDRKQRRFLIYTIGDSPAYLVNRKTGVIRRVNTQDHHFKDATGQGVTFAIDSKTPVTQDKVISTGWISYQEDDVLLLASDAVEGLEEKLGKIIKNTGSLQEATDEIYKLVKKTGVNDHITAVCVELGHEHPQLLSREARKKLKRYFKFGVAIGGVATVGGLAAHLLFSTDQQAGQPVPTNPATHLETPIPAHLKSTLPPKATPLPTSTRSPTVTPVGTQQKP